MKLSMGDEFFAVLGITMSLILLEEEFPQNFVLSFDG